MNSAEDEHEAIETAAAEWLARRDRGFTREEAVAFERWCAASALHRAAVEDLSLVWSALDDLSAVNNSQQRAGGAVTTPPAPLAAKPTKAIESGSRRAHRSATILRWWPALGLAAALVVAGAMFWSSGEREGDRARYETVVGMQRTLTLPDGSEVQLNTNSALNVQFTKSERRLVLLRGDVFLRVTKDPARPFVVTVPGGEARVRGTAFMVRLREKTSEVLVAEGQVSFGRSSATGRILGRAQQGVLPRAGADEPRIDTVNDAELERRLAWRKGWLEFKETPLRDVAAEFNRYHRQRLVLRDAATEDVPVGGAFEIGNLQGFVRLLDNFDVVVVRENPDEVVLGLRL